MWPLLLSSVDAMLGKAKWERFTISDLFRYWPLAAVHITEIQAK
jgi:hypothetical protein